MEFRKLYHGDDPRFPLRSQWDFRVDKDWGGSLGQVPHFGAGKFEFGETEEDTQSQPASREKKPDRNSGFLALDKAPCYFSPHVPAGEPWYLLPFNEGTYPPERQMILPRSLSY